MQTAPDDRRDRIVGRVLEGRYRVLERLARGGMSTVYRALDERLDRPVAVKVMSAALSTDPAFADRFTREARVAARLSHLNAVSVYDQGSDDGHVFLVMELVLGRTLRDLLREQGVLSPAQAVSIMEPVLGALAAAHRAGLVHRDVKPENILLSDDGAVKVADFGLARAIEADASSTRTGLMMGTVAYCPPEQIARGSADARSDVYSAGVVLFELLTGGPPYTGDSAMAVAYQHVNSQVPRPSSRRPGIPPQLDDIVQRATSREPSGRPLDAGAFLAELHDARVDLGLPVVGVPPRPSGGASLEDTQRIARVPAGPPPPPDHRPAHEASTARTAPTAGSRYADGVQHTAVHPRADVVPEPDGRPARKEPKPPPSRRRRARRRVFVVVLLILLLGLLTGWGAWYLVVGRYHQVPNLTGQAQSVATQQLRDSGFAVSPDTDQEFSETAPAGTVLGTKPDAGSHLLGGKPVELVLSKGAERFTVPTLAGKTADQVPAAFAGLPVQSRLVSRADPSGQIPAGQVISTDPTANAKVKRNAVITVYVSAGPPVVVVPDVRNKNADDAAGALTAAGFKVATGEDYSDTVPAGAVIDQNPAPKASAHKFDTVNLVVSKGPQLVMIPDFPAGSDPDAARSVLQGLGLTVDVQKKRKSLFDFSGYTVDRTAPGAGASVKVGSTVVLYVK